jgi:HD domain
MAQSLSAPDVEKLFPELSWIGDTSLRTAVVNIWREVAVEMVWDDVQHVPKNVHDEKDRTLIDHVRGVTQMAVAICDIAKNLHGKAYDKDMMVASCLLHDVSKLVEYEPDPAAGEASSLPRPGRKSRLGKNVQHAVYAAHKILAKGLSLELVNLVVTHTHESNIRGATWEAAALFYADFADSDVGVSDAGATLYVQRWKL